MTQFELKNPRFRANAGATAFQAGIPQSNNPYTVRNDRELWEKGYRAAKKFYETGKPVNVVKHSPWKRNAGTGTHGTNNHALSQGRIERFNNKYRTTV